MTSLVTIQREVEKIRQRVLPKPKDELWIIFLFPLNANYPHGKYGGQKFEIHGHKYEAIPEKEELERLRKEFDGIPVEVRQRTDYWDTWEHFLEHHRCKCGKHE